MRYCEALSGYLMRGWTLPKLLSIAIRTLIGVFAALVGSGAFLSASYLTGIGGIGLALLATANPPRFKERWKVSFWLVFVAWILLFLMWSYVDMSAASAVN